MQQDQNDDPAEFCKAQPDAPCCDMVNDISAKCTDFIDNDDNDDDGRLDRLCPSSCYSTIQSYRSSLPAGTNRNTSSLACNAVRLDIEYTATSCLKSPQDSTKYCVDTLFDVQNELSAARVDSAAVGQNLDVLCKPSGAGAQDSCTLQLESLYRELFEDNLVFIGETNDDTGASVTVDFADFFQMQDELYCIRATPDDYCVRVLAAGGFYDTQIDDDVFSDRQMGLRCSPCGRAVTSVAIRSVGGSTATFATVAYGCADRGRAFNGTYYCVNDFVGSAQAIEAGCVGSNILDSDRHGGLNCSSACGEAIRAAAANDGCCARGSLLATALRNRASSFQPPVPDLDQFVDGLTATCPGLASGDIPSRCKGPQTVSMKAKVTNMKADYLRSDVAVLARVTSAVQYDLSRQVGGPSDSASVWQWQQMQDGVLFDFRLRLESDDATNGAAQALQQQSIDGTIMPHDTRRLLEPSQADAFILPNEPLYLQVQLATAGNYFPPPPGAKTDGAGVRAAGAGLLSAVGVALALSRLL